MKFVKITLLSLLFVLFLTTSCASRKELVYLQGASNAKELVSYEPVLQPDDVVMIVVSSENPEVAAPYNLKAITVQGDSENTIGTQRMQTYILDKEGKIEFPLLGSIALGGLTKTQAVVKLKELLKDHVSDAVINFRILNFKVTVLGEVQKPGTYSVASERITLLEAIGMSGDLTIYGNRTNVLLIREKNGTKTMERIDLTKSDFLNSSAYYLSQNDVVYIEPNKTRINSSAIGPNLTVGISALSLIVTIIALTVK
ncbi:polysaccharide export outer membrane protein [Flavobacterium aquaticum]|uniref:Polysaccharide export outer membrane protein n=1 Tax=Flavobacterium aquaticum TaxID=1236486 RepID=A0A327YP68_9FLAO|nr:polysaccharide biosynthesis/export family protein [Flavobacterium aquaticum]RAK22710.1 polysaccharide export outer membrane protein [Flavobacterium aquaticum]